ncbi:MAG: hypothetical protein WAK40_00555 [Thermoplasmata archaeon]
MGEPRIARSGARYRRARRLDRSTRGVAAVIGTLLSLLVFFALFGIFLTQYLPLWMDSNEAQFTAQADEAISTFKSNVDAQSALGGPAVYATTFPLSSQGVPLLAQPTEAVLILLPPSCPGGFLASGAPVTKTACVFETEAFTSGKGAKTNTPWNQSSTTAVMEMQLPNRYFTSQTFYFEDDAVIQTQYGSHSVIVGPPPLAITKSGTNTTVTTSFLGLYGNSTVVIGQGSEEVYSQLVTSSATSSNGRFLSGTGGTGSPVTFNFTFQIGTHNLCPWYSFIEGLIQSSGLTAGAYTVSSTAALPPTATVCSDANGLTYDLTFKVLNIAYASVVQSSLAVSLGAGVA